MVQLPLLGMQLLVEVHILQELHMLELQRTRLAVELLEWLPVGQCIPGMI